MICTKNCIMPPSSLAVIGNDTSDYRADDTTRY